MKTVNDLKSKEVQEATSKEFTLKEAFVLWRNKAKSGGYYLSGTTEDKKTKLVGFFNSNKKNPKEPDIRVYALDSEGKQEVEVASLWESISENKGTRYLTGTTNENERLTGFYGKENQEARPYIRVYYK